ncbi:MAG: GNAT family N-acetyltransferase [Prevotella sp.]|jgi:N-acetylglutamate synthase-like GNAT family acetyltransferase
MISFKDVTLSDRQLIQTYTLLGENRNCDLSFANLISWRFLYDTQFAIINDCLVFRFYLGRHLAYMGPMSKEAESLTAERVTAIVDQLKADAIAMGHPLLLIGMSQNDVEKLRLTMPERFNYKPERDFFDYIYSREKLATLAGKHLQGKRNHCNKFRRLYPNYEYRELTKDLIPECLRVEEQWRESVIGQMSPSERQQLYEEQRSMTRAFLYWEHLGCMGGTIFVDGKMVAFTYGCPINHDTFDVCVEKADTSYEGSFSIINQEFVSHLPEQYVHINREEDLGDEGLRRAKMSYKPEMLLEKYSITKKEPLHCFSDSTKIKKETEQLWRDTFHDDERFIRLYFDRVYRPEENVVCLINGSVAGALQTLPYMLRCRDVEARTAYISGVSVKEEMRRQHIGTSLMSQCHNRLFGRGAVFACLIPAEPWLFGWYASCGYSQVMSAIEAPSNVTSMSFADFDRWQHSRSCFLLLNEEQFNIALDDLRMSHSTNATPAQAMIRVVNAAAALQLYARLHPDYEGNFRIYNDRDIASNNSFYKLKDGSCLQTELPLASPLTLTVSELAAFIFRDLHPEMTLMMN